jgi:hypothetical protein
MNFHIRSKILKTEEAERKRHETEEKRVMSQVGLEDIGIFSWDRELNSPQYALTGQS